ncbi:MAG TPA: 2-oxo acid dehydrogenase subunit E2, partial [Clostridiales bacterium]|nr:2-oxo acid dehydrogenase subunit E2 [Clostridiales bacterium]
MATAIIMPRQGQSVESCLITTWVKKEGDPVKNGDVLFSYETDKSSFDETSTVEGTLLKICKEEGEDVPCLEVTCVIGTPGEDISALLPSSDVSQDAPKEDTTRAAPITMAPVQAAATAAGPSDKISPRAKQLSEKTGALLSAAVPTGPDGRIIERDVQAVLDRGFVSTNEEAPATAAPISPVAPSTTDYMEEPLPHIRKVIAKAMHASLSEMAQLTLNASFDATQIRNMRNDIKANGEKLGLNNITLNDMILFAVARTLPAFRGLNAHYIDNKTMRYFQHVNLGIAVDTERGLLVPTLFGANTMSLYALSNAAKILITEAQKGTISPDMLKGGTFTVTNLGSLGVESFTPVINPPQTGILGVNTIVRRIKEVDGKDVSYPAMGLSLTFDH